MNDKYDQKEGTATDLLVHYFSTVFEKAGLNWDEDNTSEVTDIVNAIVNAAVEKATEVSAKEREDAEDLKSYRESFLKKD